MKYKLLNEAAKDELLDIINEFNIKVKKTSKKNELIDVVYELLDEEQLYENLGHKIAYHPKDVEEKLNITKTERLRWQEEGKLKISHYQSFIAYGKSLNCPMFDYKNIESITQDKIEIWRYNHKEKVKSNRKSSISKANETRKKNKEIVKNFYENEWINMINKWESIDKELAITLKLAFWTMWASRMAKQFQEKAFKAHAKNEGKYKEKKEEFYKYKNRALELLIQSKYTKVSFYRSDNPDKIYIDLCDYHYHDWCNQRSWCYMNIFDYYSENKCKVHSCNECSVDIDKDYYSLYYIEIKSEFIDDIKFSFHTPYPLASEEYYPDINTIPMVQHEENEEGLFRFGRSLFAEELIVFTETKVRKYINECISDFENYNNALLDTAL